MELTILEKAQESGERGLALLRPMLLQVPQLLMEISCELAAIQPAPTKWSKKQELGHLLDSASNNHQRLVRAQLEDQPAMPGYAGEAWVKLHAYQERDWHDLIAIWRALNQQLLTAAEAVTDSAWRRTCTIGSSSAPLTIGFILEDYVGHLKHHLDHIGLHLTSILESTSANSGDAMN